MINARCYARSKLRGKQMFETRNRLFWAGHGRARQPCAGWLLSHATARSHHPLPPTEVFKALSTSPRARFRIPIDLFFAGSTDGTFNLPAIAYRPAANARCTECARRLVDDRHPITTASACRSGASSALRDHRAAGGDVLQQHDQGARPKARELPPGRDESGASLARLRARTTRPRFRHDVDSGGKFLKHHSAQAAHAEYRRHEHRLPRDPDERHPEHGRPAGTAR